MNRFTNNCHICVKIKYSRNKYNEMLNSLNVSKRRWANISINFVIVLLVNINDWDVFYINIMIIMNRLFKNMIYECINDLIFEKIVKIFLRVMISHKKLSNNIISNRNTQFVNHFWNFLYQKLKITIKFFIVFYLEIDD